MFDLHILFKTKPADLTKFLKSKGFKIEEKTKNSENIEIVSYADYKSYAFLTYTDGRSKDDEDDKSMKGIEAFASMSGHGGISRKSWKTAKLLRDHYGAILYDPQTGKRIKNLEKYPEYIDQYLRS